MNLLGLTQTEKYFLRSKQTSDYVVKDKTLVDFGHAPDGSGSLS